MDLHCRKQTNPCHQKRQHNRSGWKISCPPETRDVPVQLQQLVSDSPGTLAVFLHRKEGTLGLKMSAKRQHPHHLRASSSHPTFVFFTVTNDHCNMFTKWRRFSAASKITRILMFLKDFLREVYLEWGKDSNNQWLQTTSTQRALATFSLRRIWAIFGEPTQFSPAFKGDKAC